MRIASLIPSGTDIVAALGLGDRLVGVSHECDHPVAAGLPTLTASRIAAGGRPGSPPPAEIDRQVTDAVRAGDSLYVADRERLAELRPDVVLSQDVCDVCAVAGRQAAEGLPPGAELVMLRATSLAGLSADLRRVGAAVGEPERAEKAVGAIQGTVGRVGERVAGAEPPRVLALEWSDPPFLGGHWVPELVALAGGTHVLSGPGAPSRRASWSQIAAADPDVVVAMPCGYGLEAALAETTALAATPPAADLRAVAEGRCWATDATRLFSRCTPNVVTALTVLAAILHPDRFPPVGRRHAVRLAGPPTAGNGQAG